MEKLIDGEKYWLGATWGIYNKQQDNFRIGNCFVNRWNTIYKDQDKKYNQYGFEC
jgi:hypothetical protein